MSGGLACGKLKGGREIKLLISATLSTPPPAPKVFSFPKQC